MRDAGQSGWMRRAGATSCLALGLWACGADATAGDADATVPPADGADSQADTQPAADTADTQPAADTADTQPAADSQAETTADTAGDATAPPPGDGWFAQTMPWAVPVRDSAEEPASDDMIGALAERGGWGNSNRFQIDFSIVVLAAPAETPLLTFTPNGDFYEGDCDLVPVPVPPGGALEGEDGYACAGDGDCHLLVRTPDTLYEMWRANIVGGDFDGGCLAVWQLTRAYPESLRGEGCTSADAAGLPIAPLLFTPEEVAAGRIDHAIRFILPNTRIAHRQYVRPATHATGAASAESLGMPYGVRLRLRADYPVAALPSEGARVVARALQEYGMILADGGQIALTAASDRGSAYRWDELLGPHDLAALAVGDFDVMPMGRVFDWSGDCERNP